MRVHKLKITFLSIALASMTILNACSNSGDDHSEDNHIHEGVETRQETSASEPDSTSNSDITLQEDTDIQTDGSDEPEHDDHEHDGEDGIIRQADRHVHGDATLAIAQDGPVLTLELESPLYNLAGFEHAPQSDSERKMISEIESVLSRPEELFYFTEKAKCTAQPVPDPIHLVDDHDHDHDDAHRDLLITYIFDCEAPQHLSDMRTELFARFSYFTELETVYLGPSRQIQTQLNATNPKMEF